MTTRTKQLVPPQALGPAGAVLYTCPAGYTGLVKTIVTYRTTGVGALTNVWGIGTGINVNPLAIHSIPTSPSAVNQEVWWVLKPGDKLWAVPSASVIVAGFGAELLGVAP